MSIITVDALALLALGIFWNGSNLANKAIKFVLIALAATNFYHLIK